MTLSGSAKLAGVIGWPVAHSLSPRLHGFWLDQNAVDGAYLPLPVAPENLDDALRALPKLGFRGANVTVPHKQAAFRAMDHVSDTARRLAAVNTIVVDADGALHGDNTDGFGFLENLKAGSPALEVQDKPVLVVGAGGAARAVVGALVDAGVAEVRLLNRTLSRAADLAQDIGGPVRPIAWNDADAGMAGVALLVNTTSLGMSGHDPLTLDLAALPLDATVNDIVYNPLRTPLLAAADARGNPVVDGLGMLLHQARPGFAAWFGVEPVVSDALRRFVEAGLQP